MKFSKLLNWKLIISLIVILVIFFFTSIINFLVDVQWFKEVGYLGVFFTKIFTEIKFGVPIFIFLTLMIYLYMFFMKKEYLRYSNKVYLKEQIKSINKKLIIISVLFSIIITVTITTSYWYEMLKFINSTPFSLKDPVFNKDISFYIFKLPVYLKLYEFVLGLLIMLTVISLFFYIFLSINSSSYEDDQYIGYNVLRMDRRKRKIIGMEVFDFAAKQMSFFIAAIFFVLAIGNFIKSYELVYSQRGIAFGASYTDIHVTLLFYRILIVLYVLAAISLFYALFKKKLKLTIWIIGLIIGVSVVQGVVEIGVQKLIVSPNEIGKEKTYIENNIKYTKIAFGLDKIEEQDFTVEQNLTPKDIQDNETTIRNIRINDFVPALDVYNQLQAIRTYYSFNDMDIDRYNISGKYTQVFISARELDQKKLDPKSQTWQNKHLVFTHGYGVAMSPVNTVTSEGQPKLVIKDIPPVSSVDIKIDRPEIYFGELTNDYIITNARLLEMDYPSGDSNKQTTYSGSAGIKLNLLNRLIFMINKGSFNFLLSQDITSNSKIIINRNILDRVKKIAPFFIYDKDPYIVINNGKLYWIIDAYTTSSLFPYSEPVGNINYIRNSVKVIIDAYNGTTDFYLIDENDPIAATYNKIFPGLLKSKGQIPDGFIDHFRYPEDIFNIQQEVYSKYHMTNPSVFYNKEDLWAIALNGQNNDNLEANGPSYVIMKLPEGSNEEFMLISPYTPYGKSNMVAWLAARMDGENYGKLIALKFPKQKVTYGPSQFIGRINEDTIISKELSLWRQQGSDAIIGNVITIPIEKSLLYIATIYTKATSASSIPEMKKVVLGYGDRIIMDDTLDKALNAMFNLNQLRPTTTQSTEQIEQSEIKNIKELIKEANDAYINAKKAQQSGNWADYGKYLYQLENILNQMNESIK